MLPLKDLTPSNILPVVTWLLIAANAVCFLFELSAPDAGSFIYTYALVPRQVDFAHPQTLWPFLTSMFLHAGWIHLISNMWFLRLFGDNTEAFFGRVGYLAVYLVSGFAGGLTQYAFGPGSGVPMLGASGAIAGVLGAYIVLYPRNEVQTLLFTFITVQVIRLPAMVALGYWFAIQLLAGVGTIGSEGGTAYFAHVGGFVTGAAIAFLMRRIRPPAAWP